MASLGRIKRSKKKIAASAKQEIKRTGGTTRFRKGPKVETGVGRLPSGIYGAEACLKKVCYTGTGRTPQSAIAKALQSLARGVAKRGRRRQGFRNATRVWRWR